MGPALDSAKQGSALIMGERSSFGIDLLDSLKHLIHSRRVPKGIQSAEWTKNSRLTPHHVLLRLNHFELAKKKSFMS